ncbi:metallophosphoesterase family protein [Aestuariicoccus sp. MJ-SS9]|uniref:metallophosphoesterase family protein n=1 Tax=Aestuariicoccus sp. MJ-SS9 TaxID=3079855 RepID=UPI00290A0D13|nr:metallophosphoesterase family protein [Aestuariicoccus sp. MJ-SS9]MDU8910171.1 metallophosphoesterase family protein [Aestuariicoccus sp. MJ-SS9]
MKLTDLLRRRRRASPPPPPSPETPFAAIGDVHGRDDLVERLLPRLAELPLVFLGDYVDRGEHSAQVLRRLKAMCDAGGRVVCLLGNHEDMMLDFLDAPEVNAERWLRNGGLQTLSSFGVAFRDGGPSGAGFAAMRDDLRQAMDPGMEAWLRALPTHYVNGNIAAVHAGADPNRPVERQEPATLLWGHPEFGRTPRRDGRWVVHGHTIHAEPTVSDRVIAIDTGAYASNILTAAVFRADTVDFVTT